MKALLELLPILIFFGVYKYDGLISATAALMVTSLALLVYRYLTTRTWDKVLLVSTGLVLAMGALTLVFKNPLFIQYKLTAFYLLLSVFLVVSAKYFGKNWIAWMIRRAVPISDTTGKTLLWGTVAFFTVTALLNVLLIQWLSLDTWVTVKTWGMLALLLCFVFWQGLVVMRDPQVQQHQAAAGKVIENADEQS